MTDRPPFNKPRWMRDLLRFLPLKSQFVLSGNVRDLQVIQTPQQACMPAPLVLALGELLREAGYAHILRYDPIQGFGVVPTLGGSAEQAEQSAELLQQLSLCAPPDGAPAGLEPLARALGPLAGFEDESVALVVEFASRLVVRPDVLTSAEHALFSRALVLSQRSEPRPRGPQAKPLFNSVLWVVENESTLPDWLLIDNPRVRHIPIAKPDPAVRRILAPTLLRTLPDAAAASGEALENASQRFVDETEGLLLVDLRAIAQLGQTEAIPLPRISDAIRRYKVGVTEDPWKKIERRKIHEGESFIHARVKGQDRAVTHMLDLVKRAITGVGPGRGSGRPRGVAFLAGPTGVGKTELAKTVTSLLFGDEEAYIRFDMSEFSAEHADQRLLGAPPGYVGYDAGGELTNAIREKPFSVVLFDEIEKAHPRILDKFLQILDDGVLTSGRGDRVYFSEALIVFTSNLGIYSTRADGERVPNVTPADDYETVARRVREEIENHFKLVLNRPEILNRIGENIIVFDFIREKVAEEIFDHMVASTLRGLSEQSITVSLNPEPRDALQKVCLADLTHGGRGIRNQLEVHLVNPLARALFAHGDATGETFRVTALVPREVTTLTLESCS